MGRAKSASRLYERNGRFYGDFRDYAAEGGGREALKPKGASYATDDRDEATSLLARRLDELKDIRRGRRDRDGAPTLASAAEAYHVHLREHVKPRPVDGWLTQVQRHLLVALEFFGSGTDINTIQPADLRRYVKELRAQSNGRGSVLSEGTVRKYLNSLSGMYSLAMADHYGVVERNPVAAMKAKPVDESAGTVEALPAHEVALLLVVAEHLKDHAPAPGTYPFFHELFATIALTGMRWSEARGLLLADVDTQGHRLFVEPNAFRPRLKNRASQRHVPIWPQLQEVLYPHVARRREAGGELLFPGDPGASTEAMVDNVKRQLRTAAKVAGLPERDPEDPSHYYLRWHRLRYSYIAQRLQTIEHGRPIQVYTVGREVGHSDGEMIKDRYGSVMARGPNPEVVEWRTEHHLAAIGDRLKALKVA